MAPYLRLRAPRTCVCDANFDNSAICTKIAAKVCAT